MKRASNVLWEGTSYLSKMMLLLAVVVSLMLALPAVAPAIADSDNDGFADSVDGVCANPMVSADWYNSAGLRGDGTVVATGDNYYGQLNVGSWTDIIQVASAGEATVGLKSDGTVVGTGRNDYGQVNVGSWTDIIAISAGGWETVGLKSDGTVVATGWNWMGGLNVGSWTDIVAIAAGSLHTLGLKSDGTVVGAGRANAWPGADSWTNIVAISASQYFSVGLKSDGTVVAVGGGNSNGELNVGSWTDIVAISNGDYHTVGLKSDGTVVAVGSNSSGQLNVGSWTNIVAIAADGLYTIGLKSDGTVVGTGYNGYGQLNVGNWFLGYRNPDTDNNGLPDICEVKVPAQSVTLTASRANPVMTSTLVTLEANASGGSGPYDYKFWVKDAVTGATSVVQDYGNGNTTQWSTTVPGNYQFTVYAKNTGSAAAWEAIKKLTVEVISATPVSGLHLSINKASVFPGEGVVVTANATGDSGSYDYKFWLLNPATGMWEIVQDYGKGNVLNWSTMTPGTYTFTVYAKNLGSNAGYEAIKRISVVVYPLSVDLNWTGQPVNKISAGTPMTFSASMSAIGSFDYKFFVKDRATGIWTMMQDYGNGNNWFWIPPAGEYNVIVYAKQQGSPLSFQAITSMALHVY